MAMLAPKTYKAYDFQISGLNGISDQQVQVHLGLYQGYVKNTNLLNQRLSELLKEGKAGTPDYAELSRRLGFEYDGMILHEHYFGVLRPGGVPLDPNSKLAKAISDSFGSFDAWMSDFRAIGQMRGVGWAVLFQNPINGWLSNHWITLHQDGVPAGFRPVLVMDVWEHAFMVDYKPAERAKYIDAFFQNLDWPAVEHGLI
ncbi:MAG: superoxide dismutase [Chloroflexota bacterium]